MSNDTDKTAKASPNSADKTLNSNANIAPDKTLNTNAAPDKTLNSNANAASDKTQNANAGATLKNEVFKTLNAAQSNNAAVKQEIEDLSKGYEAEYKLNGVTYKTLKVLSTTSGEARIFLVENNKKQYVLKLYYYGQHPDHDILETLHKTTGSGLLIDVYAHGVWTNERNPDEQLDFEIMNYCSGGSLDGVVLRGNEEALREIAIRAASAIDFCSKHNILHRDIKPANFFYTDDKKRQIILADFGIAAKCPQNGSCRVDTARTPIYAAPEFYTHVPGERPEIDIRSDYYSLGIMLLCLWMGRAELAGSESELLKNKLNESLPYPTDMSSHMLSLIKALTRLMPNKRCTFPDIVRWAKGEVIFEEEKKAPEKKTFEIIFNAGKNQTAHSPEELADFMRRDPELAKKYLYTGKITKWLNDAQRPELAMNVEHIVETLYPKDKYAGLFAACYMLDPAMPYYDITGKPLDTTEGIAQSLVDNFDGYCKTLSNPADPLFIYLNVSGLKKISDTYPALIKKNSRHGLWQLIYALAPKMPYYLVTEKKQRIACNTCDDVLRAVHDNMLDPNCWNDLSSEMFITWVAQRDPAIAGRVRSQIKGREGRATYCVLYNLNPKVSFTMQLDENADDYYFTHSQIGEYINHALVNLIAFGEENSVLVDIQDMPETQLYDYFKSKGVYDDKISWIEYCMDVGSKDNVNKYGPYDVTYGIFKAIKGLGYDPYFYFPDSKKVVTKLDDLKSVPAKEIKRHLSEDTGLKAWIATFFQEDPNKPLDTQFAYEKETVKFVEFIEKLDKKDEDVVNFRIATDIVDKNRKKVRFAYGAFTTMRILLGVLCFVPIIAMIVALLWFGLPFDTNPMPTFSFSALATMTVIFGLIVWILGDFDSLIGSAIIGGMAAAVVYYIAYFALALIAPFAPYVLAALLAGLAIYLINKCYFKLPSNYKDNKYLVHPTFEETGVEPLHFAFKADADAYFDSSIADLSEEYVDELKQKMKSFALRAIPTILLVGGLMYLFVLITPALSGIQWTSSSSDTGWVGHYTGTFEGRNATMDITEVDGDKVKATITVRYSNAITEELSGTIDTREGVMQLDDVVRNGRLDGQYQAILDGDSFYGIYKNYTTQKEVNFSFSK